jgi:CheY-like chemotaxis protein
VVDDNDDIRDAIVFVLSEEKYYVLGAKNGRDAFKKLKTLDQPSLILLDLMMPVMNGWEFLHMRKLWNETSNPVVTMSAVRPNLSTDAPLPVDVVDNLSKPIDFYQLLLLARKYCHKKIESEAIV